MCVWRAGVNKMILLGQVAFECRSFKGLGI